MSLSGGRQPDARDLKGRVIGLGIVFGLGLLVLAVNLYRLMVVRHDELMALSVANEFKDVRLRALRGRIIDSRGEVLVDSRPSYDVFVTPAFCQKCTTEVLPRLSSLLGWTAEQQEKATQQVRATHGPQRYLGLILQVDLGRDAFDLLVAHKHHLPGVDVEPVPHRDYRPGATLAHVIGFMNELTPDEYNRLNRGSAERPPYALGDYIGRRGIERTFEHYLRGRDGWVKQVVNARGEVMRDEGRGAVERERVPSRPGLDVVMSIDGRLQAEAERAFPGVAGAVVVLDPRTGFIKALVSRPAFDPNEMTGRVSPQRLAQLNRDPLQPLVFRAGAQHYAPGSTFKLATLFAALRTGVNTPATTVTCPGGYRLGSRVWRCHKESGHGPVDALRAVQVSCDTYFYRTADVMGIDAIAEAARDLGLGAPTGLGVVGEVPGIIPDTAYHDRVTPGGYQKGMALNTAIGQGDVTVTPLQLAVMYATIANGGTVYQPQLVERVQTAEGSVVESFQPRVVRQSGMTPELQALLSEALRRVVNEPGGTGGRSRLPDVQVAGKTGTAQVAKLGAVRLKTEQMAYFERDHAWFAAFAPATEPELVVVVLNEHGGHGGTDSAPTAKAVFARYFELKKAEGQAFGPGWAPPASGPRDAGVAVARLPEPEVPDAGAQASGPAPDAGTAVTDAAIPATEVP